VFQREKARLWQVVPIEPAQVRHLFWRIDVRVARCELRLQPNGDIVLALICKDIVGYREKARLGDGDTRFFTHLGNRALLKVLTLVKVSARRRPCSCAMASSTFE